MDAQQFLKAFGHVTNAPGGVDKLRELVRTLAIKGKLVAQEAGDKHADSLLQQIRTDKDRLISLGQMRRERPWPSIAEHEIPFELPPGWSWARFGEVSINRDGERVPVSSVERLCRGFSQPPSILVKSCPAGQSAFPFHRQGQSPWLFDLTKLC